jgi:hypothetical protein
MIRDMALKTMLHGMQKKVKIFSGHVKLYQRQTGIAVHKGVLAGGIEIPAAERGSLNYFNKMLQI